MSKDRVDNSLSCLNQTYINKMKEQVHFTNNVPNIIKSLKLYKKLDWSMNILSIKLCCIKNRINYLYSNKNILFFIPSVFILIRS